MIIVQVSHLSCLEEPLALEQRGRKRRLAWSPFPAEETDKKKEKITLFSHLVNLDSQIAESEQVH